MLSTYLVQGSYPEELLASWDDYKAKQTPPSDEQIRPRECLSPASHARNSQLTPPRPADVFTSTQLYALILLEHAGTDLESYKLKTWKGAASVFAQAVEALARAEEACGFEVRARDVRLDASSAALTGEMACSTGTYTGATFSYGRSRRIRLRSQRPAWPACA